MKVLSLLFTLCLFYKTNAQTPEQLLEKINSNYTAEKIYIQYDKSNYIAGETIWFKAYLMEGFMPSIKSTVIGIELLNESGVIIDKKVLPIVGSAAIGEFTIPKSLPQGSYIVKAFTQHLMNFGSERFYYQKINIYNPTTPANTQSEPTVFSVYFFAEGGNIIANTKNTIAFKCTDKFGNPQNVSGNIIDSKNNEILSFTSTHNGMGKFEFTPKPGEKYFADCMMGSTQKKMKALPDILPEGIVLNLKMKDGKTTFNIDASTIVNENLKPSYILGVQENQIAFKVPFQSADKNIFGLIPTENLPTGILQVTVFTKENKPLAERLLFINSGDYIPNSSFKSENINLTSHMKNTFSFALDDTLNGTFAVSVTDGNLEKSKEDNIVSRFLLTDDIKGLVYDPTYYFEAKDYIHEQNLDLVMLTNGWRRYSWDEIFTNRFPKMDFKDPGFITLNAVALDPTFKKPILNTELTVFVKTKDKPLDLLMTSTDSVGRISLSGMMFEDSAKLNFLNKGGKKQKVYLQITSRPTRDLFNTANTAIPPIYFNKPSEQYQEKIKEVFLFNQNPNSNGILLDEIKILTKAKSEKEKFEKKYTTGRLGNMANKELDFLSDPPKSSLNIFDYLKSRLNGVNITGGPLNYSIVYRNARSLLGGPIQMSVFLDEAQVDASFISTMKVSDIAMVKVFANGLSPTSGGTLALYTKRDNGNGPNSMLANTIEETIEGFSPTKEFFSPDYALGKENDVKMDERTTLYWNPYLNTDSESNKISFSFYNADKVKKFRIIIEGILEDGKLLHIEKMIE